jgi:hypothetical protein
MLNYLKTWVGKEGGEVEKARIMGTSPGTVE